MNDIDPLPVLSVIAVIALLLFVLAMIFRHVVGNQCPQCGSNWTEEGSVTFNDEVEWECKTCGWTWFRELKE
jgi:transposase-like protein